jgi:hypothetical protein
MPSLSAAALLANGPVFGRGTRGELGIVHCRRSAMKNVHDLYFFWSIHPQSPRIRTGFFWFEVTITDRAPADKRRMQLTIAARLRYSLLWVSFN